ncbi:hypothetical protein PSTT_05338 [Puccinia striiformis]|uniref:Uncharacterized protein n=1 Tax=Puccinia striiformis TaxID=27350 RepID=A0A2S4VP84_9BASI|nr:hypothetical protein PSTT_05338 [Puccinia striiformis]
MTETIWLLFLASSIPILQVLAGTDQGLSPVRRQTLEKRWGVCMVPNRRKGCVVWGSQSCCRDCCSELSHQFTPLESTFSLLDHCSIPSSPLYSPRELEDSMWLSTTTPPHTVVVVQQAAPPPPPAPAPAPAPAQGPTIVINHPGAQPAVAYPQPVVAYPAQPGVVYVH